MSNRKTKAQLEAELAELRKQLIKAQPQVQVELDQEQQEETAKPTFDPKSTLVAWLPTIIAVIVIGLMLLLQKRDSGGNDPQPEPAQSISQVLADAYAADRQSKIEILRGLDAGTFESDEAKLRWINEQSASRRERDFVEFNNRVAAAIVSGKVLEAAKQLEADK